MKHTPDSVNDIKKGRKYVFIQFFIIALVLVSVYVEKNYLNYDGIPFISSLGIIILSLGLILLVITVVNFSQFITPNPMPLDSYRLRTKGIYSLIRHPMYFSIILIFSGFIIWQNAFVSILLLVILIYFFLVKIDFEEKLLREKFKEYDEYINKTKKIIPFIY